MRVIRGLTSRIPRPLCLAMGVFDGVHRGHREVIAAAVRRGARSRILPAALTFEPHPDAVLSSAGAPPLLTTTAEKLALFRDLGVRLTVVASFDRKLADTPPEDFVREALLGRLHARCLVVGEGWRFGAAGKGATPLLHEMAADLGFRVSVVQPIIVGGAKVSSTRIRGLLARGRVSAAAEVLGRRYEVAGEVVAGAGLGRKLGYPTANLNPAKDKLVPADGVYACLAGRRRLWPAVAYIGRRPTAARKGARTVEVHLLTPGGSGSARRPPDLRGRVVRVEFISRLRGDKKFPSLEALRKQIARDCSRARRILTALHDSDDVL
ncbi:MAG: riboflavin biosynthesis protein RibF [Armatimonadota bacterium]|nr:MAG: riboflavin biosynthesis protein RibF [Armatimonadota bacterium]